MKVLPPLIRGCLLSTLRKLLLLTVSASVFQQYSVAQTVPDFLWAKESSVIQWNFEYNPNGWTNISSSVTNFRQESGCLRGSSLGNDPYISIPSQQLQLRDTAGVVVRVWFSQASNLQLYWANEDGGFASARRVNKPVPAQQWTTLRFDLSTHSQWIGKTIQQLRIDPGIAAGIDFAIDYVAVVDQIGERDASLITKAYDFSGDSQGWTTSSSNISGLRWEDSKLKGTSTGINPTITGPSFSYASAGGIVVQVKSSLDTTFSIYWSSASASGFANTRKAVRQVTSAGWQTLWFDLRDDPTWAGQTITQLRIDPGKLTGQDFEIGSIVLLNPESFDDQDLDGLNTFSENLNLSDPGTPTSIHGSLVMETWDPMPYQSTRSLVADNGFYAAPEKLLILKDSTTDQQIGTYYSTRIRGQIIAPTTGNYRFWISGRNGVELYLSEDHTKYRKRRIAEINPDIGCGHGIAYGVSNLWDQFSSQMSVDIFLQKGQSYFFETLQSVGHAGNSHVSLAWAPPGDSRKRIPITALRSYAVELTDADDDYLPDVWEAQYGLDLQDNGRIDIARQGERGDFDGDGLTNREEYLLDTNPANPDTDGDGSSDSDEVNRYGTSPKVGNSIINTLVDSPLLTSYNTANTSGTWQIFDGGLLGSSFRGKIQWNFTVPADGWWVVDLAGRLRGTLRSVEDLALGITIDGKSLAEQNLRFLNGQPASLKVITPYLQAGTHTLSVDIRNEIGRRTFQIQSLQVFGLGGFDGDGNGRPDWVDNMLTQSNQLVPVANESCVSPLFIEGSVRHLGGATVKASSVDLPVMRGLGDLHWYANVPLEEVATTSIDVGLENQSQSTGVTWTRWNAMAGQSLTIRVGDSVKIGAWLGLDDTGSAAISADGLSQTISSNDYIIKSFSVAGVYPVTVSHSSGVQTTSSITVVSADFGNPDRFYADSVTWRTFLNVPSSLNISSESSLVIQTAQPYGTGQKVQFRPFRGGNHVLAARIPNGPIVALGSITTMGISDALRSDAAVYIGSTPDGYRVLRTPIVLTNLPTGGTVVLTIFRAGVTFLDGLTVKTLSADEFVDGVAYVDFRFPGDQTGGYCHYIDVYDAAGNSLGRH